MNDFFTRTFNMVGEGDQSAVGNDIWASLKSYGGCPHVCGLWQVGGRREGGEECRYQGQEAQAQCNKGTQGRATGLEQHLRREPEE